MHLDRDFSEFIECLRDREVRFLIVGGYAVAAHGHPRYTGDLDVWLLVGPENAVRLLRALDDFGFGAVGLTVDDFMESGRVVQLGYPPLRIDLMTSADGVQFDDCGTNASRSLSRASPYRSSASRIFAVTRWRAGGPRTSPTWRRSKTEQWERLLSSSSLTPRGAAGPTRTDVELNQSTQASPADGSACVRVLIRRAAAAMASTHVVLGSLGS